MCFSISYPQGTVVSKELLPDWDHFYVLMKAMLHRVPCLLDAYPEKLTNAPEPFSPDGQWILGKAPEVFQLEKKYIWSFV